MLSLRLKAIASLIKKKDNIIDIGCDHGYLCLYLAHLGCAKLIASDINPNALNNAIANIKKEKMEDKIMTVLSDGLTNINVKGFNTVVISGMGTSTILKILADAHKLENIEKIIVQSNNDLFSLRKVMNSRGYIIKQELVVLDKNKYYVIIEFIKGVYKYNYSEFMYGPILIKKKDSKDYFHYLLTKNITILNKVPKLKILIRMKIKKQIKIIKKILVSN